MAYEVADFNKDVLEASHNQPVLVDFWAPWCGPCRSLGPVLEKLASENADRWKLIKVNTDEHQQISMQYGIRGIPAVKLFIDGQVVNEFTGALPEHMVKQWLDESIPSEAGQQLATARAALEAGNQTDGTRMLREFLAASPENAEARLLLARAVAQDDIEEAGTLIEGLSVDDAASLDIIESIKTLRRLADLAQNGEALPEETGKKAYHAAMQALVNKDWDAALENFIAVIQQNRYYDDDGSRKAVIAIFHLLGNHHPLTLKHRRMFDMVLY